MDWYKCNVTLLWRYSSGKGRVLFSKKRLYRWTFIITPSIETSSVSTCTSFEVIQNNHWDYHAQFWTITRVSNFRRASYRDTQHSISLPSAALSLSRLSSFSAVLFMYIYSVLGKSHFLPTAQLTIYHLRHTKPVSLFITSDKEEIGSESSWGRHHRTVFVLII